MTPLPKRKTSKGRHGRRRNAYSQRKVTKSVVCKHCKAQKLAHHACPNCGKK